MKLALIGNGAIAKLVTTFCAARSGRYKVVGALGLPSDIVSVGAYPVVQTWDELQAFKPDLVVECAGHGAVKAHGPAVLKSGLDLVVVSTGSLADATLWEALQSAAAAGAEVSTRSANVGAIVGADSGTDVGTGESCWATPGAAAATSVSNGLSWVANSSSSESMRGGDQASMTLLYFSWPVM